MISDAEILAALNAVPLFAWVLIAAGVAVPYFIVLFPMLSSWYYQRKLENRLARDAWILQDELAEYESRIEDVPPINHRHIWITGILQGVTAGGSVAFLEAGWDSYKFYAFLFGMVLLGVLYDKWRAINDPPPEAEDESGEYGFARGDIAEVPVEAVAGLVGGILFVVVIVFFIMSL